MEIMSQIYNGEIKPCEKIVPHDAIYKEASQRVEELIAQLEKELEADDYEKIEELCQCLSAIGDNLAEESFKYGLSMGLRLMKEAEELL